MYESPIEIIVGKLQSQMDDDILKAVQAYHINVDKDELVKALQYDRDQYDKGYAAGKRDAERVSGEWIIHYEQKNIYGGVAIECSECHEKYVVRRVADENFCRHCGACMRR